MTMQRQYNLPNCTIILEGLTNAPSGMGSMDILMKAECHFTGSTQVISGGRAFWESLVKTVNSYAQECLSGLRHPEEQKEGVDIVHLERNLEKSTHRLIIKPLPEEGGDREKIEIELNTVELFDLVEAVDQFFADTTTLPEITQPLQAVSKRYRVVEEPLVQRATPPVLGLVTVALAGFAFFMMPIPETRKVEPKPEGNTTETIPQPITTPVVPQSTETTPQPTTTPVVPQSTETTPQPTTTPVVPQSKEITPQPQSNGKETIPKSSTTPIPQSKKAISPSTTNTITPEKTQIPEPKK